ncbi:hypothetical protein BDQ17DRAFT_1365332 [Cyathus striatus]|nr:hypothetical protein BDQ17DRAFT_1365332 [Cyathus striatus]
MSTYDDGFNDGLNEGLNEGLQGCTELTRSFTGVYGKPWIYGNISAGVLYGAILVIVIAYLRILVVHVKGEKPLSKQQWILSIYVAGTFVLSTLQISGAWQNTAEGLHSLGCSESNFAPFFGRSWLQNACYMLTAWTVDMIMMWRFFIIYHDLKRTKWSIFVLSSLIQTASVGIGIYSAIVMSDSTGLNRFGLFTVDGDFYLVVFEAVTLFQNIMLTTLIVGRLLLCCHRIRKVLGRSYGNEYTSIASMVVESQLLLGIAQVLMLASLIETNAGGLMYSTAFYQVTGQIHVLSPMILIYRVMQGRMCNTQTIAQITQLRFNNDDGPGPNSAA